MPKVLIADKLSPSAVEVFRRNGIEADVAVGLTPEELKEKISAYDGLAVRSATKVTSSILTSASGLKVVGRAGIGVDNIDVPAATQRGIVVMNTPGGNAITTAEHAISMMLALARRIPQANESTKAGRWEKSKFTGVEVTNKILGVVGCGNIGAIVADRARGLKMRVVAYDPFLSHERARDIGVRKVDTLDELYKDADFITLHVPMTDQTKGMIDAGAMTQMKPGVRIINCARGGLIVEEDLKAAIQEGQVAGAAIDVFEEEPAKSNPLFELEETICTPHLGASTNEAQEKVAVQIAEQMSDFLLTGAVSNALNMPSLTAEESERLGPYMTLAEQLGSFAGQLTESGLRAVTLEYEGHVAELNTRPLTQTALASLLRPMLDTVNMVNAPVIARERDIDVAEIKYERPSDYHTLIRLTVQTENQKRSVAGTLFGGDKPRLVEIKGIPVEAEVGPHMLYITNEDKPGLIGNLGRTLGDAGVNIATFHLGRAARGSDAIALIEIDEPLSPPVLDQVRKLPHIKQVKPLRF
ncbi:phosphoglycerate dehydrogenase [Ferruginivarius sediminum]|uniref:D-3-phosphoglycerate dehydrogenase n=1 Tax=Ferruginivarius sediminum TaxID=2661937 RepID=A0A369TBL6_9PROT|nr:phosphoglycerate dehydrogenase [Ferruginivarius sediminum]RDD61567.1 phosphoglycerate dehydrogenase [Ferruginivarius sediminum]